MKKITIFLTSLLLVLICAFPAFAETDLPAVVNEDRKGSIYIEYSEQNGQGDISVEGAEFKFYKVAYLNDEGEFVSVINGIQQFSEDDDMGSVLEIVKKAYADGNVSGGIAYNTVTNAKGRADVQAVEQGLYIAENSKTPDWYFQADPFYASIPFQYENQWIYELTAEPKACSFGELSLKKIVSGLGDRNKEWHFKVTFADEDNGIEYAKEVMCIFPDGSSGVIKSGDSVTLKSGQEVLFKYIPTGLTYTITETEANEDGYITSVANEDGTMVSNIDNKEVYGTSGTISMKRDSVVFTNEILVRTGDTNILIAVGIFIILFMILIQVIMVRELKKHKKNGRI